MAKNIIDNSAVFTCNQGIGVSFKPLPGQIIAKENGKYYLNENTKCVLVPGQCKLQPNPSGAGYLPCNQMQIPVTGWQGKDSVVSVGGAKALTTDASTTCPLSGKISLHGVCNTVFNAGCSLTITEIVINKQSKRDKSQKKVNGRNGLCKKEQEGLQNEKKDIISDETRRITEAEENNKNEITNKYALCPYEECNEREGCPYFNAIPKVDNDAAKLKKNFEQERPSDDKEYKNAHLNARKEYSDYGWGYEGHHIIPGNQVFMTKMSNGDLKYGHLLMLADMCGYDINNAINCILLPSMARREGPWGTLDVYVKEAKAFDVMDIMKRQWHLGGHEYTIPKDSLKYYIPTDVQVQASGINEYFPNYATSVRARLDKLNDRYSKKRCWKKIDSPEFRQKFIEIMNQTSKEIEQILLRFSKRPKDCYPFFVTKLSVDYAYDAPKTGKIIIIYQQEGKVYASKFRVSRLQKNNYQIIVTQNGEIPEMEINESSMQDFVRYSENIMHFWIDDKIGCLLPWECSSEYISVRLINTDNINDYAQNCSTEMFTFIDKNEMHNQGQLYQIRKRWREAKENVGFYNKINGTS